VSLSRPSPAMPPLWVRSRCAKRVNYPLAVECDLTKLTSALDELEATKAFVSIRPDVDEAEHSLEMHLPYIRHIFKGWVYARVTRQTTNASRDDLKLVPLIVGQPSAKNEKQISTVLEKYWKDPETFFIVSSDFCHWYVCATPRPYWLASLLEASRGGY